MTARGAQKGSRSKWDHALLQEFKTSTFCRTTAQIRKDYEIKANKGFRILDIFRYYDIYLSAQRTTIDTYTLYLNTRPSTHHTPRQRKQETFGKWLIPDRFHTPPLPTKMPCSDGLLSLSHVFRQLNQIEKDMMLKGPPIEKTTTHSPFDRHYSQAQAIAQKLELIPPSEFIEDLEL